MGVVLQLPLQLASSPATRLGILVGLLVLVAAVFAYFARRARKEREAREAPLVEVERLPRSIAPPPQKVTRELHPGSDRHSIHPSGEAPGVASRGGRIESVHPVAPGPVRASERPPHMLHGEPPARSHSVRPPRPISLDELPPPRDTLE